MEPLPPYHLNQIVHSPLLQQTVLPDALMDHLALVDRLTLMDRPLLGVHLLQNHQVLQEEFWKQYFVCARSRLVMSMR